MIQERDQFAALHMTFRYALGRATYASSEVVAMLKHAWPKMDKGQRFMIITEINEAIGRGCAGMDQDVKEWQSILELGL